MYHLLIFIKLAKSCDFYDFSIVNIFQIWACHVTNARKFSELSQSPDTPLNFRKYQDSDALLLCFEHVDTKWYLLLPTPLEFELWSII